jgi:DNA polymerase sigma
MVAVQRINQLVDRNSQSMDRMNVLHGSLSTIINPLFPDYQLFAFGSAVALGVMEQGSDIDFVALDKRNVADGQGQDPGTQTARAVQAHLLGQLAKEIRSRNPTWAVEEVKRTRVPVLRVQCPLGHWDLTVNRRNGVRNSWLLRRYYEQYPQGRWLVLAVKLWSKDTAMNGPLGYLTSYGFNLLCIYYLILRGKMQFVPPETMDVAAVPHTPTFLPLQDADTAELGTLINDFLRFYLEEFDVEKDVVSLSRPGITAKGQLNWTTVAEEVRAVNGDGKVYYRLAIEDPYEVNLNVGRNVSPFKFDMMGKHFARALELGLLQPKSL